MKAKLNILIGIKLAWIPYLFSTLSMNKEFNKNEKNLKLYSSLFYPKIRYSINKYLDYGIQVEKIKLKNKITKYIKDNACICKSIELQNENQNYSILIIDNKENTFANNKFDLSKYLSNKKIKKFKKLFIISTNYMFNNNNIMLFDFGSIFIQNNYDFMKLKVISKLVKYISLEAIITITDYSYSYSPIEMDKFINYMKMYLRSNFIMSEKYIIYYGLKQNVRIARNKNKFIALFSNMMNMFEYNFRIYDDSYTACNEFMLHSNLIRDIFIKLKEKKLDKSSFIFEHWEMSLLEASLLRLITYIILAFGMELLCDFVPKFDIKPKVNTLDMIKNRLGVKNNN